MPDVGKFFGSLFGSAASGVASPAAAMVDGASKIIGMFKLSPELKAKLQAELTAENLDLEKTELAASLAQVQGQLAINEKEAESTNWFIAGWRPAVGWVCVLGLFYAYVAEPFLKFGLTLYRADLVAKLPTLDTGTLISGLLIPLLGLAGLRTFEKLKDVEGNR